MNINLNSPTSLLPTDWSTAQAGNKSHVTADSASGDQVTVDTSKTFIRTLAAKTMEAPPTRQDKIAQLRQAINSGTYRSDAHTTADAMIQGGE